MHTNARARPQAAVPTAGRRPSRVALAASFLIALAGLFAPGHALAEGTCRGQNMLDEMKTAEPDRHARIMGAAAKVENAGALLWRIEKPGVAASHLFGTVHLTDERVTRLSPKVTAALHGAKRVALEVADLSPASTAKAIGGVVPLILFSDGRRLDGMISGEEFAKARSALAKAGLPEQMAPMVRPWLVYMMLAMSDCERQRAASGIPVLDMKLAAEGRARGIEVVGLETLEGQLQAMAGVPEAQQIDMLKASLKFADRTADLVETMLQLYLGRQMGAVWPMQLALAEKVGISPKAFEGFESALLVKRNAAMHDHALPLVAAGNAFIGVGALHLIGGQGLVELFRRSGHTVTAVE